MTRHIPASAPMGAARAFPLLILCALIALACILRSPLTSVPPVIGEIRRDLDINATMAALLTSVPVLCFGLLSPVASKLIARFGIQDAVYVTIVGTGLGMVLRPYSGLSGMLLGTFVIGASLAVGNIVALLVIARDFPKHMGMVTGIYTAAINVGTMLTGALTAPIAAQSGWQFALASWVWLPALALALWFWVGRLQEAPVAASGPVAKTSGSLWKRPITWVIALGFTLHLFIYYAITAWLPAFLIDVNGMDRTQAGYVASIFQILSLLGSFAVPALARVMPLGLQLAGMGLLWLLTPLGMLLIPGEWLLWLVVGAIAQGGTFVVLFMLVMQHASDLAENRRLSTVGQGFGYTLASLGPIVVGHIHDISGIWSPGLWLLVGLSAILVFAGLFVTRVPAPSR